MDNSQIHLPGSQVKSIIVDSNSVSINFSKAYIVNSMTGSKERTRWWQAGALVLDGVESETLEKALSGPFVCMGGDVDANVYTYRDMIPIPFASRGHIRVLLRFEGEEKPLDVVASSIRLDLVDVPKYIEHILPGAID